VPTLINCIYNAHQFWDGRVSSLEEVVQGTLEDERTENTSEPFRHVWGGVVRRLENGRYRYQFLDVFGTPPTADAVGKALATYLRTLLAGNSLHDRAALRQTGASTEMTASLFEHILNEADLATLGRAGANKSEVAQELLEGYRLFFGISERQRVDCAACHSGQQFTDSGFHNLGLDREPPPGQETGRFRVVPVGQKDRYLIGAYKTPTLRSLLRTNPYYHDGRESDLAAVVSGHAQRNRYLDPELFDVTNDRIRGYDLNKKEIERLVLFLRALNGEEVADEVTRRGVNPASP
jgi:cytochrome c peroxidase